MTGNVRLIWDFFGPHAQRTAEHHRRHVEEFATREGLAGTQSGAEPFAEAHWMAWLIVAAPDVDRVRAALKPQRGLPA